MPVIVPLTSDRNFTPSVTGESLCHGVPGTAEGPQIDVPEGFCVTVNVRPAIVSVPCRWLFPKFGATSYETVPLPFPDAPDVIVSQDVLLIAIQAQPAGAVTVTVLLAPAASGKALEGAIENEQLVARMVRVSSPTAAKEPPPDAIA